MLNGRVYLPSWLKGEKKEEEISGFHLELGEFDQSRQLLNPSTAAGLNPSDVQVIYRPVFLADISFSQKGRSMLGSGHIQISKPNGVLTILQNICNCHDVRPQTLEIAFLGRCCPLQRYTAFEDQIQNSPSSTPPQMINLSHSTNVRRQSYQDFSKLPGLRRK